MSKAIIARGPRPSDIDSNEDVSRDADKDPEFDKDNKREADKDIEDHPRKAKRQNSSKTEVMQFFCLDLLYFCPSNVCDLPNYIHVLPQIFFLTGG